MQTVMTLLRDEVREPAIEATIDRTELYVADEIFLAGTAAAALMGLAAGLICIHRQGIYFAMVTLALAQMMYFFFLQAPFTGGEDGIQAVPRGKLFGLFSHSASSAFPPFCPSSFLLPLYFPTFAPPKVRATIAGISL
mgnify:CR=1 FL=1